MDAKVKTLIIKLLILIFGMPLILFLAIRMLYAYLSFMLFIYPLIFIALLARIIMEYFDKKIYGDYTSLLIIWLGVPFGIISTLIIFAAIFLLSSGFQLKKPEILRIGAVIIPLLLSVFLSRNLGSLIILPGAFIIYTLINFIGYYLLKLEKKYLWIDLGSNLFILFLCIFFAEFIQSLLF